jgi:hypothetical protein
MTTSGEGKAGAGDVISGKRQTKGLHPFLKEAVS